MANKWVTHDFSNYPPGGPLSSTYLADADEFNQNYQDVCDAVGARYVRGAACADKNSTPTTCEIWLAADGGARDVCDAGWHALIYYGDENVWETTVLVSGSDCYIVFGDGQLKNPTASGISDYSAAPFIDGLHILLFAKKMRLPADWLITTEGAGGGLGTDQIAHEGDTLAAFINDAKARLDTICKETGQGGGLKAEVVDSTAIDGAEAVKFDNPVNLLAGGSLDHYGDEHNLLFRVAKTTPPAQEYAIETNDTDGSARAQKVMADGSNQGIILELNPDFADAILADKDVAASFRVKTSVTDSLEIGFLEGDTTYSGTTPNITAATWSTVTVTKKIGTGASHVRAYVRANQACDFLVARAQTNLGDKAFGFSIAPYEDAARILMDTTQDNLFFNGGFERWTLSEGNPSDGWFAIGGGTFASAALTSVGACTGNKSCKATLAANDGMGQYLGLVTDTAYAGGCVNENILVGLVRGAKVCASVDMMYDATSTGKITLVLGDRVDTTTYEEEEFDVEPLNEQMRRFTVYKEITADAKQVYFKVLNKEAATKVVTVDNAMLHVGEFPLMFKPSSGWREERWDFGMAGAASVSYMAAAGVPGGKYLVPSGASGYLILKGAVKAFTAPLGGSNTFKAEVGAYDGLVLTLGDGEDNAVNHDTAYNEGDGYQATTTIAAKCTVLGGVANESANIVLSLWGYYYGP